MLLTGLTLAFATIPEELPILITVVLGLGALHLSRRHAIVKRLRAAETLGSVSVIATDKTGTITENRMALSEVLLPGQAGALPISDAAAMAAGCGLLEIGVLANDARPADGADAFVGDPTDIALLAAARAAGLDFAQLRGQGPIEEFTFDERRTLMSAVYRREGGLLVAVKGAPEAVLSRCTDGDHATALAAADDMAARGLRVLALASRMLPSDSSDLTAEAVEADLTFAGLVGLLDPPRAEVPEALRTLRGAGVRVLMLTGDHPTTAQAIAGEVGIDSDRTLIGREVEALDEAGLRRAVEEVSVYARIAPEHKLRLVRALQARGEVVAVTGDGVNDAPALKEAAIGVAMGETGTDVAKEAADMVLADDNFATIAVAVREGRKLFENLRKAVRFYLAAKVALVSSSLLAVLAHLPVPFSPIQIIVTELFMDLGASVSFTTEPSEGDVMARSPRDPRRPFMDGEMQFGIFAGGLSLCAAVLGAYLWATFRGVTTAHAQAVAFATWMIGHVILAFHMRSLRQPLLLRLFSNSATLIWAGAAVGLVLVAAHVPALSQVLKVTPLVPREWLVAALAPVVATSWWEAWKLRVWRMRTAVSD
jgi:Ca2+-transporting ATPase